MKRKALAKKRGRKRRTAHPIPLLLRHQDGSEIMRIYHTSVPVIDMPSSVPVDLRQLAKGRECYARLPGCLRTTETVVLAHLRRGHVAGMGQKPPDICAMPMCGKCHDLTDGRAPHYDLPLHWIDAELLRGLCQWLAWLWNNGHISAKDESK